MNNTLHTFYNINFPVAVDQWKGGDTIAQRVEFLSARGIVNC